LPAAESYLPTRSGSDAWAFRGAAFAVVAVCAYTLVITGHFIATNVDASWLIVVGDRLLSGERLHVDVVETNPPFSVALYLPFVILERVTTIPAETWMRYAVVALAVASVLVASRILVRVDPAYRQPRFVWIVPFACFLILMFFPDQFGQREQFALMALLPWLALQAARDRTAGFRAATMAQILVAGLGAAFVVMVKPHYTLAIVVPSLALAIGRRSLRPLFVAENLIGAAISTAYVAYIVLFDPAYLDLFETLLEPLYLPLRESLGELIWKPAGLAYIAGTTIIVAGGARHLHRDARLLLLSAAGFVPAYVLMGKGWPYHAWPFLALGLIGLTLQILQQPRVAAWSPVRKAVAVIGLLYAISVPGVLQLIPHVGGERDPLALNGRAAAAIMAVVEHPTLASLSAVPHTTHPLVRMAGARFVSRHPSAWAINNAELMILRSHDAQQREKLVRVRDGLIAEMAAEIGKKRPDVVVYDTVPQRHFRSLMQPGMEGFSWSALVLENPAIAHQLSNYRELHREGSIIYLIRVDIAGPGPSQ